MAKDAPRKVPALRFKGFTEDWKESKISDFSESTFGGGTPKTDVEEYWNGELPWIQSSDLSEHQVCAVHARKRITKLGVEKSATKLVPANSIAVVTRVGVGKLALMPFEYSTSQDFLSFSHLKVNGLFGVYSLYARLQRDLHAVQGTSIKGITKKELLNKKIRIPISLDEQAKIGSFLKKLDTTIILRQHYIFELQRLKKTYLAKLFPVKDQHKPAIRFSGFSGNWVERRLGEIANIVGGGTPSTKVPEYWNGSIDWYAPAEINDRIFMKSSNRKITQLGLDKSSATILPVGTILYTSRAGIGKTAILAKEGSTNQGFQSIVPNPQRLDSYFIYAQSEKLKRYGERNGAGSTFVEISGKQLSKMKITIPTIREQLKIGLLISKSDSIIAIHRNKLSKLQSLKSSLLNKLFM